MYMSVHLTKEMNLLFGSPKTCPPPTGNYPLPLTVISCPSQLFPDVPGSRRDEFRRGDLVADTLTILEAEALTNG